MNIDDETLSQVLSSLKDYNPTANDLMEKLSTALVPVAMVVLGILMYIEYADLNRKLTVEQGRVNMELFISVVWKYLVAYVCVMASDQIIDSIVWLNSAAGWILDKVVPNKTMDNIEIKEVTKGLNWLQKGFISSMQGMTYFALWASEIITKVMNFLRFVTLFMIKGLAPMLFVFFVSDEWREIAKGFMKQLFAVVLQGLVLVLVLKLFPTIMTDDLIKVAASGHFEEALANIFLVFAKVIIFIITIVGSQRVAKTMDRSILIWQYNQPFIKTYQNLNLSIDGINKTTTQNGLGNDSRKHHNYCRGFLYYRLSFWIAAFLTAVLLIGPPVLKGTGKWMKCIMRWIFISEYKTDIINQDKSGGIHQMSLRRKKASKNLTLAQVRKKQRLEKQVASTSNTIKYTSNFEDGLMHILEDKETGVNEWSKVYKMGNLDYEVASDDDQLNVVASYGEALNSVDKLSRYQLLVLNKKIKSSILKDILFDFEEDGQNQLRDEVNTIISNRYSKDQRSFEIKNILSFPLKRIVANKPIENLIHFLKIIKSVSMNLM